MTITQKFLLLFADYREALDRVTTAEDEARFERGRADTLAAELAASQKDTIERERVITDRMMAIKHGPRAILTNDQIAEAALTTQPRAERAPPSDVREWQRKQTANTLDVFDKFDKRVNG